MRPELIGSSIGEVSVQDAGGAGDFIRENRVDIAILSTDRAHAQTAADWLIAGGIRAIWNFTEQEIDPGDSGVLVESIHFSDSLLTLSYHLVKGEEES